MVRSVGDRVVSMNVPPPERPPRHNEGQAEFQNGGEPAKIGGRGFFLPNHIVNGRVHADGLVTSEKSNENELCVRACVATQPTLLPSIKQNDKPKERPFPANFRRRTSLKPFVFCSSQPNSFVAKHYRAPHMAASRFFQGTEGSQLLTQRGDDDCGICLAQIKTRGKLPSCEHRFCCECILQWAKVTNTCPLCKARFREVTRLEVGRRRGGGRGEVSREVLPVPDREQREDEDEALAGALGSDEDIEGGVSDGGSELNGYESDDGENFSMVSLP